MVLRPWRDRSFLLRATRRSSMMSKFLTSASSFFIDRHEYMRHLAAAFDGTLDDWEEIMENACEDVMG